ncbi:MAG: hypothetical protein ABR595_04385 [Psychroflexus sp.]
MQNKLIYVLLLSSLIGFSQENSNEVKNNKGFVNSVAVELHRNYRDLDFSKLNTRLTDLNLPNSFSDEVNTNYIGIVWNFNFLNKKPFLGLSYASAEENTTNNSLEMDSRLLSFRADLGYKIFTNQNFTLSFTAGMVVDKLSLSINNNHESAEEFDEVALTFNSQKLEIDELISINLSPRFTYYIFENLGAFVSTGYQFQVNDSEWKSNDTELINAPDLNLDSFSASLGITYRFVNH